MIDVKDIPASGVMKIVLTSFLGARLDTVLDEDGKEELCVCIPIDRNNLKVGTTGKVSAYAFVNKTRNANRYGWTHYLKMKYNINFVKKINELGYDAPYIGNIKPASFVIHKKGYQNTLKGQKVKVTDYE